MSNAELPILPLLLHEVPPGLVLALRQEGVPTAPLPTVSLAPAARGRFVLFDSAALAPRAIGALLAPGQQAIDVAPLRAAFTFDPFEALTNGESRYARWEIDGTRLHEHVSRYDKLRVRRKLLEGVRRLVEQRGGLWMRVAGYPFPYRSAFNFRIDYDECDLDDFRSVVEQVERQPECFSHFVCVAAWQHQREALKRLAGWDVASHGFYHHTYRDRAENRANLERGIDALVALGFEPSGFAAPFGRWNSESAEDLAELGVTHSSEFGLAHDELPFFPYTRSGLAAPGAGQFCDVLQVPVHPICLGLFLEAGQRDETRIVEYFCRVARAKYDAGMPLFFYGHPTGRLGRFRRLIPSLLETARGFGALWKTTMTEFATWWRMRSATTFSAWPTADGFELLLRVPEGSFPLAVEYWMGEHVAVLPVRGTALRFSTGALAFERRRPVDELPQPTDADESHGLRESLRRYLDWEAVTPYEELKARDPRTLLKKGLRYLRAGRRRDERVVNS